MEGARANLGELGELSQKTEAAERNILKSAEKRLTLVQQQIVRAQPGIEGADDAAQDRYTALITERGQLQMVIEKAKQALA
jgi:hypothetical protein